MTYTTAKQILNGRSSIKVQHNTRLHPIDGGIALRVWETDIILFRPNGELFVDCRGFRSKLTKDRLNEFLPTGTLRIHQKANEWFWTDGTKYEDGQTIRPDGTIKRQYNKNETCNF